jgi:hypothetical protein
VRNDLIIPASSTTLAGPFFFLLLDLVLPSRCFLLTDNSNESYFMGTYMYTGLIHEFQVAKSYKPDKVSLDSFKAEVAGAVVSNPEHYSCNEVHGMFIWRLPQKARDAYLVDLLSRYYGDFYGLQSPDFAEQCKPAIEFFLTRPTDEKLAEWLEESDGFSDLDGWFRTVKIGGKEVTVHFSVWSLSCEGKVMVEELERHLRFFERAIRKTYADNPLGGSLAVDVG